MARTLTVANNVIASLQQKERLVVRPIEDMLDTVKNNDLTTAKSISDESQDMQEDITEFRKKISPVIILKDAESGVHLDRDLTYDDGAKKLDQISEHQTGILLEELFEIEENPHIDIKEKEDRKEIILDQIDHAATAWNGEPQVDEPYMEQPHIEQPHMEQPHAEEPRPDPDESRDLRAINSVVMTPSSMSQTQENGEFKTVEEIKTEEEQLIMEIERRGELQRIINERLARIRKMREFLRKTSPINDIGEIEAKEENERMEKRLNEAINDSFTLVEQNTNFSDKFTIVDDNGKSACEASIIVTLKDKRPKKNREKKTYRITYDITESQINRSCYVFTSDDTVPLQINEARKTTEASTSEMNVRENLPTKPNSNETVQLRKRRKTHRNTSLRNRRAHEPKKRRGRDPMTITRNEKGRFIKKKNL